MSRRRVFVLPLLLLAGQLSGCATGPDRPGVLSASFEPPAAACDTSVRSIDLLSRLANTSGGDLGFHLVGDKGPPYDLWYMGYRVYEAAPGGPFELVHDSGQDAQWTRTVAIAPGGSADFRTPLFALRPGDYHRWFRIELRDADNRSYWTRVFELCAVLTANCGCPRPSAQAVGWQGPPLACPTASAADRCP
jgi:hypothetical protein